MRVLIADGDEAFLEVAQRYLSHHGYEAKIATNGLESVSILRRFVPDVVVLERELLWGGSEGVRAFMLQVPRLSEIPVILTSEDLVPDELANTAGPPLAAQLQKPDCLEDLLDHLQARGRHGLSGLSCRGSHSMTVLPEKGSTVWRIVIREFVKTALTWRNENAGAQSQSR